MNEPTELRNFIAKVIGAFALLVIGVLGLTIPPLLATGPVLSGALITAAAAALGITIGASVQNTQMRNRVRALEAQVGDKPLKIERVVVDTKPEPSIFSAVPEVKVAPSRKRSPKNIDADIELARKQAAYDAASAKKKSK